MIEIDARQYAANSGPCLEAARRQHPVRAVVGERRASWPEFTAAAERAGVRAYLSVPLLLDDGRDGAELLGSLNIYSQTAAAFDPFDEGLLRLFAIAAGEAIRNARRWQRSRHLVANLETALTSRAEIDQAKGILIALHGYTADEAFAALARQSQQRNIKLRQLAHELVESAREAARCSPTAAD